MRCTKTATVLLLAVLASACAALRPGPMSTPDGTKSQTTAKAASKEPLVDAQWRHTYERALRYMKANRLADAERELTALTAKEPQLAGPYANLGIVYHRLGRPADAVRALARAIELNPRAAYYNELGMLHRTEGRFDAAERAYLAALDLDPDYAYAHLNLGILYDLYIQRPEKALPHYERYQALEPGEADTVRKWIADLQRRSSKAAHQGKHGRNG